MSTVVHLKIGLDANRPIDPETGAIQPQVAEPAIIAGTGAHWVRLNFILKPWSSPNDPSLHEGRTWLQTYQQIISGLRAKGLNVYGLIGAEAMAEGPGDRLRLAPPGGTGQEWIGQYAEQFATIAGLFRQDVQVLESFNEPDDWAGKTCNWVHPGWFAILLQRVHTAVRSRPELDPIKLVSGPLQGLESNRNAAAQYLSQTYRAGKKSLRWGKPGVPFPFDGVGYHLYVRPGYEPSHSLLERSIRRACRSYLDALHQVIRQEEGRDKPLYVSEIGWTSSVDFQEGPREEKFQADCLRVGVQTVAADPLVDLTCWFCTHDIPSASHELYYGLFRLGTLAPQNRKPAYEAFQALCRGEVTPEPEELVVTNQAVITAFYRAAEELGLANRWGLLTKAGLSLAALAADRSGIYAGTPVDRLPNLTETEKAACLRRLETMAAAAPPPVEEKELAPAEAGEVELDLSAAMLDQILQELRENRALLERLVEECAALRSQLSSRGRSRKPS